ncbi:hypothetical protein D3C87_1801770 [compost metagenome]
MVLGDGQSAPIEVRETAFHVHMEPGGIITFHRAGGGGWGNPLLREPGKVLEDVLNGIVSVEGAEREYGVGIVRVDGGFAVDDRKTAELRQQKEG